MLLVIDTNVLFSFFRENPVRSIIITSKSFGLGLFTPEYSIDELRNNKSDLFKYSGLIANLLSIRKNRAWLYCL